MINLTYQYKLEPTKAQSQTMSDWLETSRKVWNYALGERKDWQKSKSCRIDACSIKSEYIIPADAQRPTFNSQAKALTEAKKTNPDFKAVQSAVLQQVLKRLEHAPTQT